MPRQGARSVEQIGPFTLFNRPWRPSYARPSLGSSIFTPEDVGRVAERQRTLGLPEAFEWVKETTPSLRAVLEAAGFGVSEHPLMQLVDPLAVAAPEDVTIRLATDDDDPALTGALAEVAFGSPGTARGPQGVAEMLARATSQALDPAADAFQRQQRRTGKSVWAVAVVGRQPVGGGGHQPVDRVTEIVGVGVLPAFRRRGIGAALTGFLAQDALARGVQTVFLSAGDETIGRVYERVGFRRVATACTAEPRRSSRYANNSSGERNQVEQ
jgi:ribosomal protein S18 acetylase RimI-like enzyme